MSLGKNGRPWSVLASLVLLGCVRAGPAQPTSTAGSAAAGIEGGGTGQQPAYPGPAVSQELRVAQLEAQVAQLSAMVTVMNGAQRFSEPELRVIYDRVAALTELQQKTYSALMLRTDTSCTDEPSGDDDLEAGSEPSSSDLRAPTDERSLRLVLRALDRMHLTAEQRRTLLLSLYPQRSLDPHNPWAPR